MERMNCTLPLSTIACGPARHLGPPRDGPILPDSLSAIIGQEVKLFLPTGVSGPLILEEVTDYDLICSGRGMKELVFERASVLNIVTREED